MGQDFNNNYYSTVIFTFILIIHTTHELGGVVACEYQALTGRIVIPTRFRLILRDEKFFHDPRKVGLFGVRLHLR